MTTFPWNTTKRTEKPAMAGEVTPRTFKTGAYRDQDTAKHDLEGYLSPLVMARFAAYMHKNRTLPNGDTRPSDNWQRGMPRQSYMKSLWRHLMTAWAHHRNVAEADAEDIEEALCGVLFNAQGYLHEHLKEKRAMQIALEVDA